MSDNERLAVGSITFGPASSFPQDWYVADAKSVAQLQIVKDKYEDRYFATEAALAAANERITLLTKAITDHNDACQDLCGRGDQEAVRCQYRPYFEANGRRCPECPTYNMIELPDAAIDAALDRRKP